MYQRLQEDMDINCGQIIEGQPSVQQMGQQIFDQIISVASGRPTLSETLGFGDNEFAPLNTGKLSISILMPLNLIREP